MRCPAAAVEAAASCAAVSCCDCEVSSAGALSSTGWPPTPTAAVGDSAGACFVGSCGRAEGSSAPSQAAHGGGHQRAHEFRMGWGRCARDWGLAPRQLQPQQRHWGGRPAFARAATAVSRCLSPSRLPQERPEERSAEGSGGVEGVASGGLWGSSAPVASMTARASASLSVSVRVLGTSPSTDRISRGKRRFFTHLAGLLALPHSYKRARGSHRHTRSYLNAGRDLWTRGIITVSSSVQRLAWLLACLLAALVVVDAVDA